MLVTENYFNSYMGYTPPQFERWYDIAISDLKYLFPCLTETLIETLPEQELIILKKAICIQIDYRFTNQDSINNIASFSVGKFSVSKGNQSKVSRYSRGAYDMLRDVFSECSGLWVKKGKCSC